MSKGQNRISVMNACESVLLPSEIEIKTKTDSNFSDFTILDKSVICPFIVSGQTINISFTVWGSWQPENKKGIPYNLMKVCLAISNIIKAEQAELKAIYQAGKALTGNTSDDLIEMAYQEFLSLAA